MAQNVLTDTGFNRPTLAVLVQRIGDRLEAAVGPISRKPDSNTGQFIGSVAEEIAIAYETTEAVWLSRFIESATGFALDAIGEWMGGTARRGRSQTQVNAVVYGEESRPVPAGALASFQNYTFVLTQAVTITRGSLVDGSFNITDPSQASYSARVNGLDYTYTRKAADTASNIAQGLASLINGSPNYSASSNGSLVKMTSENMVEGYSVSLSAGMTWNKIGSPAIFSAVDYGAISVPVGALNNPVSAIAGWTGVNNLVAGSTGSERETDSAYRQRLQNSLGAGEGKATINAIKSALLNDVEGVTLAEVLENDTLFPTAEIDAKSILCIVDGGLEQEIAQKIWDMKAGGISTSGDILVTAYDTSGRPHGVYFSRSGRTPVYIRVKVDKQNPEEGLPANIVSLIESGVANYFATLGLGDDVVIQRIYGYVYANTTGIAKMTITASTDGSSFSANDITIPETGSAQLTSTEVTGV